jgi:UDP-glucose 4-epimerase
MAVCLVTGGAGFIGSRLVETLVNRGHEVRVLDNFSTGRLANLTKVLKSIELFRGDLAEAPTTRAAVKGVELIFHLAGSPLVPRSLADPLATHQACATGTLQMLLAARNAGVKRVIYAGSIGNYARAENGVVGRDDLKGPLSPYSIATLAGEYYCVAFSRLFGLETVRLRFGNVYGPRQLAEGPQGAVIPAFLRAMLGGQRPRINGDGLQARDFTYVDDVVQASLLAAEVGRVSGKVYNIAFGRLTTLLELVQLLNELLGTRLKPIHDAPRFGEVRYRLADTSLAQKELGFCPCTDLRHGLQCCTDYWLAERQKGEDAVPDALGPLRQPHFPLRRGPDHSIPLTGRDSEGSR